MLEDVQGLRFGENEILIDTFYDLLFDWREKKLVDVLKGYCELSGNAVNQEMQCYFASEFPSYDEDYFGETGVAFYFDPPAVDEECVVILTQDEFFEVVKTRYEAYARSHPEKSEVISTLLAQLMKSINAAV